MKEHVRGLILAAAGAVLFLGAGAEPAQATEPCGDFGACKVLIEINATDGDIGFHFLMDGSDLNSGRITDPNGVRVFEDKAKGPLKQQKLTETFAESAEPLCWPDPEADPDDEIVTLEQFLARWTAGTYIFSGLSDGGEMSLGATQLTYALPAAPSALAFDGSVITWAAGNTELDGDLFQQHFLLARPVFPVPLSMALVMSTRPSGRDHDQQRGRGLPDL